MVYLQIEFSDEELQELQEVALQQGFETPEEYILSKVRAVIANLSKNDEVVANKNEE
jgi:hypothetical protein